MVVLFALHLWCILTFSVENLQWVLKFWDGFLELRLMRMLGAILKAI